MDEKKISVIIPVYNSESYLKRCLDSVLAQSFTDLDIVIIENGSRDNSPAICDEYEKKDARIRAFHGENEGISAARNKGLSLAKGDFITFVDSDDYIEPDYCEGLLRLLLENGAGLSCGAIRDVYKDNENARQETSVTKIYSPREALSEMLRGKMINGSLTCKLYRREIICGKEFPVGLTYEDAWLLPDIILDAGRISVTDRTYYTYWHRADSITTAKFSERALDAIKAYRHVHEVVEKRCPECLPEADFRLYWSYFVVLDRMLASENYKEIPQYREVVAFLKENASNIRKCPYFEKTRRIAAAALKAGVPFYRILHKFHQKRTEANE